MGHFATNLLPALKLTATVRAFRHVSLFLWRSPCTIQIAIAKNRSSPGFMLKLRLSEIRRSVTASRFRSGRQKTKEATKSFSLTSNAAGSLGENSPQPAALRWPAVFFVGVRGHGGILAGGCQGQVFHRCKSPIWRKNDHFCAVHKLSVHCRFHVRRMAAAVNSRNSQRRKSSAGITLRPQLD